MTPEETYLATLHELQGIAARCPHVTQQDVLEIAAMPVDDLRRRALIARDWHRHFSHCLDGITEIAAMPGAAPDGCWMPQQLRTVVEQLVARGNYTWQDDYRGRLKAVPKEAVPPGACVHGEGQGNG